MVLMNSIEDKKSADRLAASADRAAGIMDVVAGGAQDSHLNLCAPLNPTSEIKRTEPINTNLESGNRNLIAAANSMHAEMRRQKAEEALRKSETRYRSLLENILGGYAHCKMIFEDQRPRDFIYLEVNRAFEQLTGMTGVVGKRVTEILPDIRETNPEMFEIYGRVARSGRTERCELYIQRLKAWFLISVFAAENGGFVAVFDNITARKQAEERSQAHRQYLHALSARLISIREDERSRLAREIHDELGQMLTAIKLDLRHIENGLDDLEDDPRVNPIIDRVMEATELADTILQTVQDIATALRRGVVDSRGLTRGLRQEIARFEQRTGIACSLRAPQHEPPLPDAISTPVFRVFQEALTNVARHAAATKLEVDLQFASAGCRLIVHDNGRGISSLALTQPTSLGLVGMRERARLVGGNVSFASSPGNGTTVTMWIPLPFLLPAKP